jgi:hypothetical protein
MVISLTKLTFDKCRHDTSNFGPTMKCFASFGSCPQSRGDIGNIEYTKIYAHILAQMNQESTCIAFGDSTFEFVICNS